MHTILFIINLIVGILVLILVKCATLIAIRNLRQEYPNITFENKSSFIIKFSAKIRVFIYAFTPILNIHTLLGLCIGWDGAVEFAEDKLLEMVKSF